MNRRERRAQQFGHTPQQQTQQPPKTNENVVSTTSTENASPQHDRFATPRLTNDLENAFGPRRIHDFLPTREEIPEEFYRGYNQWAKVISGWFFEGLDKNTELDPKPGIDPAQALKHISVCLRSFEPAHEDKTAGCAYLMSKWFNRVGEAHHE